MIKPLLSRDYYAKEAELVEYNMVEVEYRCIQVCPISIVMLDSRVTCGQMGLDPIRLSGV